MAYLDLSNFILWFPALHWPVSAMALRCAYNSFRRRGTRSVRSSAGSDLKNEEQRSRSSKQSNPVSAPKKQLHVNLFEMNCVSHIIHGLWAHPTNNRHRFNEARPVGPNSRNSWSLECL